MISVISEHSVDLSLLPEKAYILDLGCRGFGFTHAMRDLGHIVYPIDIDDLQSGESYYQCAISNYDGFCGVVKTPDPQATRIGKGNDVPCYKLETFMRMEEIDFFDLIKMDVETSEKEIIHSLTKAPAKQLSIEFHLHYNFYGKDDVAEMVAKLESLGYETVSHEYTSQHGAGFNWWDSLFTLK